MCFLNIHDGSTHRLNDETLLVVPQTFEMVFRTVTIVILSTKASLQMELRARLRVGLLKRYPVTASGFPLIGKETERGWEQADDTSTPVAIAIAVPEHRRADETTTAADSAGVS
jgi:hypothetical protein